MTKQLLLGQTLGFDGDALADWQGATRHDSAGGVVIDAGLIVATGSGAALRAAHPDAAVTDYGDALISAGFVDAHMHYPQTPIIASWGKQLIDWLNTYTFPQEMRLADTDYARQVADTTFDRRMGCATRCKAPMTTAKPCWTAGTARAARPMRSPRAFRRPLPLISWRRWVRFGLNDPRF